MEEIPVNNILVVDDNPDNLRVLVNVLAQNNYKVRAALSGELALRSLEIVRSDLILLDIIMPEMDGYQVCKQIKANPKLADIPIIFISALHQVPDKIEAFSLGGVDFITKPFETDEVLMRVKTHLEIHQLQRQLAEQNDLLQKEISERKKSQQQLQRSEERFRSLVNVIPHGVAELDLTGRVTFSNASYNRIFGYERGELEGIPLWELSKETDDYQKEQSYFQQLISGPSPPTAYVGVKKRKEGSLIHVQLDFDRLYANEGELTGFVVVVTDVTPWVNAEKALRREREFTQLILDTEPNFVFVKDKDGYFVTVNQALARFFGMTPEQLISKHCSEVMGNEECAPSEQRALCTLQTLETDENYTVEDGSVLHFHSFRTPLCLADGTVHTLCISTNITTYKRIEQALRLSEQKFRQFFENEPAYCYMASADNSILDVNRAACYMLGYWKEELIGRPIEMVYAPESLLKVNRLVKLWKGDGPFKDVELTVITRYRERRIVLLSAGVVKDDAEKIQLLVYVQRDITERRRMEEALRVNEQRYRLLIGSLPDTAVILLDRKLKLLVVEGEEMTKNNFNKEDIEGKFLYEAFPGTLTSLFEPICRKALAGQATTFKHDCRPFTYIHQVLPIRNDDNAVYGCMIVSRNITGRKHIRNDH